MTTFSQFMSSMLSSNQNKGGVFKPCGQMLSELTNSMECAVRVMDTKGNYFECHGHFKAVYVARQGKVAKSHSHIITIVKSLGCDPANYSRIRIVCGKVAVSVSPIVSWDMTPYPPPHIRT